MKKEKIKLIVEITLSSLLLLGFILCIVLQYTTPDAKAIIWIRDNIWNVKESLSNFEKHIPLIIQCLIYVLISLVITRILRIIFKHRMAKNNRLKTIFTLFDGFIRYACAAIVIILILKAFGVDTTALVASVGVLTLVVGLGAQSLIADIIAGMFIIFENEYNAGEIVTINDFRGTVLEIGIRSTKLIDAAGNIKIINNSNIGDIINLSREMSLAVVDLDFPYNIPVEKIESIINDNIDRLKEKMPSIVEGPYYKGICDYKDSNVTLRLIAKCKEEDKYQIERDLRREYRVLLVENGIDMSYHQVVINYAENEKNTIKITNKEKKQAEEFVEHQKELSKDLDDQNNRD